MQAVTRALCSCLAFALLASPAAAAGGDARALRMSDARKAARTQALTASEAALGVVFDEGRANALIKVRPCTRASKRKVLCPWRTRGGLEQSDGRVVRYRCKGRARVRLRRADAPEPVADTTFDCSMQL